MTATNGADVGAAHLALGSVSVLHQLGETLVLLQVNETGFTEQDAAALFETTDCSGTPYMLKGPGVLHAQGTVIGGVAYFPLGAASIRTIGAAMDRGFTEALCLQAPERTFFPPDKCCRPGFVSGNQSVAPLSSFDLSSLGLVPPFRLVLP